MTLLAAESLDKRYGRTWALADVSFVLGEGRVTALVGPNGAGKTTLLKICLGLQQPNGGRVLIAGADPRRDRSRAVETIGFVPQSPTLYRELSVEDHVALAGVLRPGFDRGYAQARLRELNIPPTSRPGELSGGQAAQVWLAIALGTRAPLLLLDEPLADLDPLARREFLRVIADATARGDVTTLLSSHVLADVEPIAGDLLLLADGEVLMHESIVSVRHRHRIREASTNPFEGARISEFPAREGGIQELWQVEGGVPDGQAALEDVVIGYLASVRVPLGEEAPREAGA